jgi:hypothetical protein
VQRLISLNETDTEVYKGKNFSDEFPIQNDLKPNYLLHMLSNFVLEHSILWFHEDQKTGSDWNTPSSDLCRLS